MFTKLRYVAKPNQIKLDGYREDPLTNDVDVPLVIEGFAIKGHLDNEGHYVTEGFDIVSMYLDKGADFASSQAVVHLDMGQQLVWSQCPEALQWADHQVPFINGSRS